MKPTWLILVASLAAAVTLGTGCDDEGNDCAVGQADCGGICVNVSSDASNCGVCGNICASSEQCCSGFCVDTLTDESNCGSCGTSCGAQSCNAGSCGDTTAEACNNEDDDGDGAIDEDLSRSCENCLGRGTETCTAGTWGGCTAPTPAASETTCDGADDDCNGEVDEGVTTTFYRDADEDTYGDPNAPTEACTAPAGYVADDQDCDDGDADTNPDGMDGDADGTNCDAIDQNCDGTPDDGCNCSPGDVQNCGEGGEEGECTWGSQNCANVGEGPAWQECSGGVRPVAETCDGLDNDCDGETDEGMDGDLGEINNTCEAARGPFSVFIDGDTYTYTGSLYSSDGTQDIDWFVIDNDETGRACWPGVRECNFYQQATLRPPESSDHSSWEMCMEYHDGEECSGTVETTICTTPEDWNDVTGQYEILIGWQGRCAWEDGRNFHVVVRATDGSTVQNCNEYQATFRFFYLDEDTCIGDE
jgi:hypothetical protein